MAAPKELFLCAKIMQMLGAFRTLFHHTTFWRNKKAVRIYKENQN
jgi:hypothetical protein